jgi:hypothetical protein
MPMLLTESLGSAQREATHLHIESCAACSDEWSALRETWQLLDELPRVEVPSRVKDRFLAEIGQAESRGGQAPSPVVIPFRRRPAAKWLAQAAAVAIIAGGSYFVGHRNTTTTPPVTDAVILRKIPDVNVQPIAYSIAETRTLNSKTLSPNIEGRPNIENVQFVDADPSDGQISLGFDITQHVTVTGAPNDKSMVRLLSYVMQNADRVSPSRSRAIDWVRDNYAKSGKADPEIAQALAKVLRNEEHEGVRIKAADTLNTLAPKVGATAETTRDALIEALKSDPNPAVRLKAVEALARIASSGQQLNPEAIDMLRQKASQDDENLYVRVKAAEALSTLSKIHPQ